MRRGEQAATGTLDRAPHTRKIARALFRDVMARFANALAGLVLAVLLWGGAALAQQAPFVGIEPLRNTLDQIEAAAKGSRQGVRTLTDLGQRLSPLRDEIRDKIVDLEPRLADL